MTIDSPKDDEHNYKDGYWRCGRNDGCGLKAGWGTEHVGVGACKLHGGNAGAPEGNDNAVTVGAWADNFYTDFLTEAEKERVNESAELLGNKANAKEIGQHAASVSLEQFRRTGDERFLRRFESICDKFGITPPDELEVSGDMNHTGGLDVTIENRIIETDGDDE